jgi:hypothetical protein
VEAVGHVIDGDDHGVSTRRSLRLEDQQMARFDGQASSIRVGLFHGDSIRRTRKRPAPLVGLSCGMGMLPVSAKAGRA